MIRLFDDTLANNYTRNKLVKNSFKCGINVCFCNEWHRPYDLLWGHVEQVPYTSVNQNDPQLISSAFSVL